MANNTSKYSATLDTLKSIKHINNIMKNSRHNPYISMISLSESKEAIMHILHFYNVNVWKHLTNSVTWEEEQERINFYIKLYELAERGRVEIFTKKEGE